MHIPEEVTVSKDRVFHSVAFCVTNIQKNRKVDSPQTKYWRSSDIYILKVRKWRCRELASKARPTMASLGITEGQHLETWLCEALVLELSHWRWNAFPAQTETVCIGRRLSCFRGCGCGLSASRDNFRAPGAASASSSAFPLHFLFTYSMFLGIQNWQLFIRTASFDHLISEGLLRL